MTCLRQSQLTCPAAPWCPRTAAPPAAAPPGCSGRTWTNERRVQRPVWTNHSSPRLPLIEHLAHELVVERCHGHVPARSLHHASHVSRVTEFFLPNILMLFWNHSFQLLCLLMDKELCLIKQIFLVSSVLLRLSGLCDGIECSVSDIFRESRVSCCPSLQLRTLTGVCRGGILLSACLQ